jgi:hypothetical protein
MTTSSQTIRTAPAWALTTTSPPATATAPARAPNARPPRATSSCGPTSPPRHTSNGCRSAAVRVPRRARSTPTLLSWWSGAAWPPSCCRTRASRRAPRTALSACRSPTLRSPCSPSSPERLPISEPTSAPGTPTTSPPPMPTSRTWLTTRGGSCWAQHSGRS